MTEMKAGRELDALVAERVMGWRIDDADGKWTSPSPNAITHFTRPPAYSTDIAAAMEIVPRLRAFGWVYFTLQSFAPVIEQLQWSEDTMKVEWWAEFSRYRSPVEATSPHCETPAHAICLAALRATPGGTDGG